MTTDISAVADAYVRATNEQDAAGFLGLFAEDAVVDDNGRGFRGSAAIGEWSEREIFAVNVRLEVMGVEERGGETVVRSKVDGDFDRTGLPDPLVIEHSIRVEGGRIVGLRCRLAG
jgi:ketosteroid isomerase-like protein